MSTALLIVVALATSAVLGRGEHGSTAPNQALLLVAFLALAGLAWRSRRGHPPPRRLLLGASGALLLLAVAVPPTESTDLWAYAMYGRILAHHHSSPYTHAAADYPKDRFARRVTPVWRHTESVYGPVFTGLSAAGMWVAGDSPLRARLLFQGLAGAAVLAALLMVERRTRDPVAVACIGLNPVVVISVVNGGHNDALVGLALLAGVLLVLRRRPALAGLVIGLGAMVKVAALLPLVAVAAWLWRRHGSIPALFFVAGGVGIFAAGLALAGGREVIHPLQIAHHHFTGGSIWNGPRRWMTARHISEGLPGRAAGRLAREQVARWADLSVLGLAGVLVARRLRRPSPAPAAGAAGVAYMLAGSYVYPWYLAWMLPVLFLRRSRLAWVALAHAAVLYLAVLPGPSLQRLGPLEILAPEQRLQLDLYRVWLPLLELVMIAAVLAASVRPPRREDPSDGAGPAVGDRVVDQEQDDGADGGADDAHPVAVVEEGLGKETTEQRAGQAEHERP